MRAIVYSQYGTPDQLHLTEVVKPIPKAGEVLVKVVASSINSWDADNLKGDTVVVRLISGLLRPRYKIPGADIAGIVEEAGPNTINFKPGDEVFGDIAGAGFGGFAEYVAVPEKLLARKPAAISFAQAAALPQAGLLALQGLRYQGEIKNGEQILINGAGGGVGTLALQYAKMMGAEVTCVDRPDKLETLRSLGADHLIDYTQQDYTRIGKQYHKILDVTAHRSASDYSRALKPGGTFAMIGGSMGGLLIHMMLIEPLLSKFRGKKIGIMGYHPNRTDLDYLAKLLVEGKVVPVIDSIFPLSNTDDAFRHFLNGKFIGKIVVEITAAPTSSPTQ